LTLTVFFIFGEVSVMSQDPLFSQYYSNSLYLNPAFAGTAQMARFTASYHNQFPTLGSTFVSYNAGYDMPVEILQGGIGLNVMNDVQGNGTMNRLSFDGMYTYSLVVNPKFTISGGLQASYVMRFLKTGDFVLPDGIDASTGIYTGPNEVISDQSASYPDFAVGFLGYTRSWYAGLAVHHLAKPNTSFSHSYREPLPRKYTVHAGIYIPIFEKRFGREAVRLNPNAVYIQQGSQRQVNLGLEAIRNGLFAGVWSRYNRNFGMASVTAVAGYQNEKFRFAYSYDFNLLKSWVNNLGMGAHELTFLYIFEYKSHRKSKYRAIKCPKI